MLIRKKVYFNQKFAHHYYSSGNSLNTITPSYSVEYLTCIFYKSVLGESHMLYAKKNNMRLTADLMWPAIFAASIKTQLYG